MSGETKILTFSEGVAVTAPSQSFLTASQFETYADDAAYVTAKGSSAAFGDAYADSTLNVLKVHDGTSFVPYTGKPLFTDTTRYTDSDSPITLSGSQNGHLLVFDSSGGAITVNLPEISGSILPFNIAALCQVAGNDITFNRGGASDTIDGSTTKVLSVAKTGFQLNADDSTSPDIWDVLEFGSVSDGAITRAKLATGAVGEYNVVTKTTTYTATNADDLVLASTGSAWTLTLYTAVGNAGRIIEVKKTSSDNNALTIDGDGSETIDGATTDVLIAQYSSARYISNGTSWFKIGHGKKRRTQTKLLSADVNSNTTVSDLTFSNLIVGRGYHVVLQAYWRYSATEDGNVTITHDSAAVGFVRSSGTTGNSNSGGTTASFIATATTVTFVTLSLSSNLVLAGNGAKTETYATLIEDDDLETTTGF